MMLSWMLRDDEKRGTTKRGREGEDGWGNKKSKKGNDGGRRRRRRVIVSSRVARRT